VAVVVRDTAAAVTYFSGRLGLEVVSTEEVHVPPVRLTYLAAGDVLIQLVEPLDEASAMSEWLKVHGEGLHHLCFTTDDVERAVVELSDPARVPFPLGSGRGRVSGFVADGAPHGVTIEFTEAADPASSPAGAGDDSGLAGGDCPGGDGVPKRVHRAESRRSGRFEEPSRGE
jgi:methylmalonyl-CoA/ethylmalonyl-CoA epimerase